jgi:hypothetical protein
VEVAIRERRPEDVVVASLEGVAVDAAYADDALLGPSCTRALVRPASNDHASFEWARTRRRERVARDRSDVRRRRRGSR